jgi:hypothetical protein
MHVGILIHRTSLYEGDNMGDGIDLDDATDSLHQYDDPSPTARPKRKFLSPQHELINICISHFCPSMRYALLLSTDAEQMAITRKTESLWRCGQPILKLLRRQSEAILGQSSEHKLVIKRCNDMIEIAHDKFYAFPFKEVPVCWVELYREASLLKFAALAMAGVWSFGDQAFENAPPLTESQMDNMVHTMDMALIMTGPPPANDIRESVKAVMDLFQKCYIDFLKDDGHQSGRPPVKRQKVYIDQGYSQAQFPSLSIADPVIKPMNEVGRVIDLAFEVFEKHMLSPLDRDIGPEPIIIAGALEEWPARHHRAWSDPEYLMAKTIGGRRLVPIETGKSYVDAGFGQKIVTFKAFMEQYVLKPQHSLDPGYLAQYDLFAQIPSLREDIMIPDYCFATAPQPHPTSPLAAAHAKVPHLEEPLLNAWFGPAGTTTPLHTDPYHNILAQVVGKKYIRLYAPGQSKNLYARGMEDGIDMSNTSEVDVGVLAGSDGTTAEAQEADKNFPLFKDAEYVECILQEGECLYIPVGWWHYVRSLSVSFSVSFWFN